MKAIEFVGTSREDLQDFPRDVRRAIGLELTRVQEGRMPLDFKPMPAIGQGVYEIRVRLQGAWRVLYVTKFEDAVWVLHAFQKKTQQTAKGDIELAQKRYKLLGGRQ